MPTTVTATWLTRSATRRSFLQCSALAALAAAGGSPDALAQSLDMARILAGFPAGGTVDAVGRQVAERLRGSHARTVQVENKAGAGGRLAVEELRRAAPDGSSLLITPAAMLTLYPHLYPKLSYGPDDLTAVCGATSAVFGLAIGPRVPASVRTLKEFLDWAHVNAAQAAYGSPGAGTPPHYIGALLGFDSGVVLSHVPYRGAAPGVQDVVAGQTASFVGPIGDFLPHVKAGRLRVLFTSGPSRSRFLPEVPTVAEVGFRGLQQAEWYGFFLPGKAAPELVERTAASIRAALSTPEVVAALGQFGLEVNAMSPAELHKAVRDESAAWAPIVRRVDFRPES